MHLLNRPLFLLKNNIGEHPEDNPIPVRSWRSIQRSLEELSTSITYFEREIEVPFSITLSPRRTHIRVTDIGLGWDGNPTIKLLDLNQSSLRLNSNINIIDSSEAKILTQESLIGGKCLGHGKKLSNNDIYTFCDTCQGIICKSCYDSFVDSLICPGSLFNSVHSLPPSKD